MLGNCERGSGRQNGMRSLPVLVALALTLSLVTGCGADDEPVTAGDEAPPDDTERPASGAATQRYTATATVLESREHGPQLCLGAVQLSYPPQCGGPDLIGWAWDAVDGVERANGITWGDYTVVGTWDGRALTLTEPARPPQPYTGPGLDRDRFATPCPEPEGGWQVGDAERATDQAMQDALAHAQAQPEFGGAWIDQSINPAARSDQRDEAAMNDPTRLVLNLRFAGDLDRHEAEARQRWGGALCVSAAAASLADLEDLRQEVQEMVGDQMLFSSIDEVTGRVEIGVIVDDGMQRRMDERFGEGAVLVSGALRPVEG
jgi:hypothetical protein